VNSVRTSLATSCLFALSMSLGACDKSKPDGTNPPEDGATASDDGKGKGKGKGKRKRGKDKKDKDGGGEEGGGEQRSEADIEKECPGVVSETPTAMFAHPESGESTGFIRVPMGMDKDDLVEQNPFFYMTMNKDGYQSQCEAMVAFMATGMIDDDLEKDMKTFVTDFLVGNMGYKIDKIEDETVDGRKYTGAVVASSQSGPGTLWVSFENKYNSGKVFFVIIEAHPNAFAAIKPTFKASTDSLIVVPPEVPAG
jgi:hypothetical protein